MNIFRTLQFSFAACGVQVADANGEFFAWFAKM